jgi:hypothetical protein
VPAKAGARPRITAGRLPGAECGRSPTTGHVIENCGHIIPQHRPGALLALLGPFLDQARMGGAEMGTYFS